MDIPSSLSLLSNDFQAHFRGTHFESVIVGFTIPHVRNEKETGPS